MKNWLLPMAVLGVSGVGLLCASNRGRAQLRAFFDNLATSDDLFREFNRAVENELEYIQRTLDQLSETLETSRSR
jgi:hypothetical protein